MIVSLTIGLFLVVSAGVAGESYEPCLATWSYNEESNTCVRAFSEKKVTWKKASSICQSKGADLVLIQSSQKNDFVQGLLSGNRYWIGSRYNTSTKMMRFLDGGEVTPSFEAWAPRQPNNHRGNQQCIEIIRKRGGLWNDRQCKRRNHFVCEKATEEKEEKGPVQECDPGWWYYDGDATCLLYIRDVEYMPGAAIKYCNESFRASLVTIRDKKKDDFILDKVLQDGAFMVYFWIGLIRNSTLKANVWLDGEPLGDYHPWSEVDQYGTTSEKDCVQDFLHYAGDAKISAWIARPCYDLSRIICERPKHPSPQRL